MNLKRYLWAILALFIALPGTQQAQSPEKDPFDIPVLTLSKGKYEEFHDQDTVVKIGRVLFNVHTGHIVGFIEQDTLHGDDAFQADIATRWLAPDPLAEEFPSWSPFTYVEDNPIVLVDPDGRAARLAIGGDPPTTKTWKPFTRNALRRYVSSNGGDELSIKRGKYPGLEFNKIVGRSFEDAAIRSMGFSKNTKPFPVSSRMRHSKVIPDVVGDNVHAEVTRSYWGLPLSARTRILVEGSFHEIPNVEVSGPVKMDLGSLDNDSWGEMKTSATLSLSSNDHQIRGMIDVLGSKTSTSSGTKFGGALFLYTTSDTQIGVDVLQYGMQNGVAVFQATAFENPQKNGEIMFSPPQLLNSQTQLRGQILNTSPELRLQGAPTQIEIK